MKAKSFSLALILVPLGLLAQNGENVYKQNCALCHDSGAERTPSRETLRSMTADAVLGAMEFGPMISMSNRLSTAERRAVAEYVAGKTLQSLQLTPKAEAMCKANAAGANLLAGPQWSGWGVNLENTRFQSAAAAGLNAGNVGKLKLKWAFAFPGDLNAYAQPTVSGGRVYTGSQSGLVYSLDAASGCVHWYFQAGSGVRTAPVLASVGGSVLAFFGDQAGWAYAVDAATGKQVWKIRPESHPFARLTGAPVFHKGRLYIPISALEEAAAADPKFECCVFRGSVVAVDAATGKQIWQGFTITEEPKPTRKNKIGVQQYGPSGAPVWSSPTIDEKRNAIYVTTGDNYSDPPTRTSDAFVALDMDTGKMLWSRQMSENDAYSVACRMPDKTNCPDENGPDLDFGSSPILVTLPNGKRALVAGQKSGVVHALDPDQQGEVLWQTRVGKGGSLGGIQWGSAADNANVYVALSDIGRIALSFTQSTDADPKAGGGMFALRLQDGKQVWHTPPPPCGQRARCSPAQSAAVSAIPGVAFSGSVDGHIRGYATTSGKIVWDFDTMRTYETVNGVPGRGGAMDGPGPAIAGGMLIVTSGYGRWGGLPGNVLLAFSIDGK
ncbi:MAG: PQQ-binding-like beta-propeller repeat protein [Bryobacteraceae bacterium]